MVREGCAPYMSNMRGEEKIRYSCILTLYYEYSNLEYVHVHVVFRANQAEYGIRIRMVASQEYVPIQHVESAR